MKRYIKSAQTSEYDNLIEVHRITVTVDFEPVIEIDADTEILPLQNEDGSYDEAALDGYYDFIADALALFDVHDFEILEEHESPYSKSYYMSFVKKEDLESADYKYILFVRISDHDNRKSTAKAKKDFYSREAERLKRPQIKRRQTWKLKEITVNKTRYATYEEALEDIENRINNL